MRLVTWNVNSIRARLPRVLELLDDHRPDVVCVQETKVAAADFPHDALAVVGYQAVDCCEGRWNGVALLVRQDAEVTDVVTTLPGAPDVAEARWIEASVDGLRIASVYVPNGREPTHPMFAAKLTFLEAMRAHAEDLVTDGPVVVAGDFNVAHEDRDVWDPAVFAGSTHVTPAERDRLDAILEVGLIDAYRRLHPDEDGYTFFDYRMGAFRRNMGMRIDLALVSHHLEVESATVDTSYRRVNQAGDKPSDHAPLVLDITA